MSITPAALVSPDRLLGRRGGSVRVLPGTDVTSLPLHDRLARPLSDLRLSVTDRCNFRCIYCMPRSKIGSVVQPTERRRLLDFDEMVSIVSAFVELGVKKVRITGGEPLVRRDLSSLVEQLARLPIRDLCLTTNGSLLAGQAKALAEAGLGRITVSLDAIDELTFRRMTDGHTALSRVLEGIDAARRFGLTPVKINMVVQRGVNEHAILPMAAWARREGLELRFIEYMDVGCSNGWKPRDVVSADEIRERIHAQWPIDAQAPCQPNATAEQFKYRDGAGRIGIVAAVTRPFCGECSRARVSSLGEVYPCLFAPVGVDLAQALREGTDLRSIIASAWHERSDRYSELRATLLQSLPRPEMAAIGG